MILKYVSNDFLKSVIYFVLYIATCICILCITNNIYANDDYLSSGSLQHKTSSTLTCKKFPPLFKDSKNNKVVTIIAEVNTSLISVSDSIKSLQHYSFITDSVDYLKNIPGFSMIRNGGTNNNFVLRGITSSKIRILADSGEIIGACCSGMDPATAYIIPETFDILNIIKGPQTVLWGPVTSGGILQFRRYHPHFNSPQIKTCSSMIVGSNDSIYRNIDSILGNKYGYIRLIGNCNYSGNYYDGNNHPVHSAWYKWSADAILSFNFRSNTFIDINLGQGNSRVNYAVTGMDGLCFARESYGFRIETPGINDVLNSIEIQSWYHHIHHIMIDSTVSFVKNLSSTLIPKQYYCCSTQCKTNVNDVERSLWGSRGFITCQWENFQFYSGIDIQINQYRKNTQLMCDSKIHNYSLDSGIFNEFIFNMLPNKKIIGGIRIEHSVVDIHDDCYAVYYRDVTYPAGFMRYEGVIYPEFLYYLGVGVCQRLPDYWELILNRFNDNIKSKNLIFQLKPEKTIQIDMGAHLKKTKIDGWITSYIGYIKDFICYKYNNNVDSNLIQDNIVDCMKNSNANICGTEMGVSYKLNDYWLGKSNISWAWGINKDNQCILPTIPPLEGKFTCQFKKQNYNLGILWRLVSSSQYIEKFLSTFCSYNFLFKKYTQDILHTPGFGVISAYLAWRIPNYYTYTVGIDNILNKTYREHVNNFLNNYDVTQYNSKKLIYESGRTWWIKAEIIL
ncbi:TonB-dependent copper receptor [Candidatus Blochmanniella vafra str. BVAF]|uniref:TonB-dependent copper receptor n=1 Tax=Blochmanniella vafra (strain BVAF) TaxID=859654 RepID=E8Q691_BLOVB|nr:TonB-dependent receptor [Candidatus Blochmannia vafer]ADV33785.1 TonB-dependent copper receptor [Candidatus Blochmannia vafer str. BVAF]